MRTGHTELLRKVGLRVTQPRIELLGLLDHTKEPITHADAVRLLGERGGDPATTYRNLLKLVEVGLARVASVVGGVTYFEKVSADGNSAPHPHFHCRECGAISCLEEASVNPPTGPWAESLKDAELTFVGRCPVCRNSELSGVS